MIVYILSEPCLFILFDGDPVTWKDMMLFRMFRKIDD